MHDSIAIPAGQNVFMSVYRTKLAGHCRLITVTWCKNLLLHGLSVSVQGPNDADQIHNYKVELKPWYFWRKQGSKHFTINNTRVDIVWDLKTAKFNNKTEPISDYYVAIVCEQEVVLLLGDLKKDAYRKTHCRPSLIEPTLVSRTEHVFGKKRFSTRVELKEHGTRFHDISIECSSKFSKSFDGVDMVLEIRVDGHIAVLVKHLQWKFRGNECIEISKHKVDVYWDVHDWIFGSGPRPGLFLFKSSSCPSSSPSSSSSSKSNLPSQFSSLLAKTQFTEPEEEEDIDSNESAKFCLFLYAWKVE